MSYVDDTFVFTRILKASPFSDENNLESEGRHSPVGQSAMTDTSVQTDRELRSSPVVRLALDMVKLVRDRLRHGGSKFNSFLVQSFNVAYQMLVHII